MENDHRHQYSEQGRHNEIFRSAVPRGLIGVGFPSALSQS